MTHSNHPRRRNSDNPFSMLSRSRRRFLSQATAIAGSTLLPTTFGTLGLSSVTSASNAERPPGRLKVAALFTHFTEGSHSDLLLDKFLEPYLFNGTMISPQFDVVSFYIDKFPSKSDDNGTEQGVGLNSDDIGRDVARSYGIPIYSSVEGALCLGTTQLAVDAVLSIGEYGYRSVAALSDREFPKWRFLKEAVSVMRKSNRTVPLFNDKNFTYRWDWGKQMFETARQAGVPLMAGSSVPLAQRRPTLELPPDAEIAEIISIHGGDLEGYDYHGVELLQSLAEGRRGGETGISRVQQLSGDAVWQAADEGRWSIPLAEAAINADPEHRKVSLRAMITAPPRVILIDYKDGTRGAALSFGGVGFCAACRLKGDSIDRATSFYGGPWGSRSLFSALAYAVQHFFTTGTPPYPAERTLLAGGALDAAMHSNSQGGKPIPTPHLEFAYTPGDWRSVREMGSSWESMPPNAPPPPGLRRNGKPVVSTSMFDGRSLDGWQSVPTERASDWSVQKGTIVGQGSTNGLAYLVWNDRHITDFELELEYRIPDKGNSGIEIRCQPDKSQQRPFVGYHADLGHVGIGARILGAWDFHFDGSRKEHPCHRGTLLTIDQNDQPHATNIPGALTEADIRDRDWNQVRILAVGNHFQFFINGKLASEFTDNSQHGRLDQGAIGLQIHDKGMRLEFKNLRIKRLNT
ncbi:MAG: DUF1080 domain-containing protein [Planctomycetota bacterium]|nr:DUF1080 domain-containing protein [Planctomycetota bacterium]MDA1177676.1 DUF1080 domain-containing protein [Planctomycetota bacterium]